MEKLTVKCYRKNATVFGGNKNLDIDFAWFKEFMTEEAMNVIEQNITTAFPDACPDSIADVMQTIGIHVSPMTR